MNKITATTYETNVSKYSAFLADEAWKARDEEVWVNNVQDLITSDGVILDAGCGLGRLLPRLWSAKKIVLVEPDIKRFLHASVVAKCLIKEDEELLKKLQYHDFLQTDEYDLLLQEINSSPLKSEKVHLLNDVMQSKAISQYGTFDLIVCSHIWEHISLDVIQESLAAFYNFLKPNGSLVIFACKSPILHHLHASKEFNHEHQQILITREEFFEICKKGHSAGLGIRYMPFDLFPTLLANPFNPTFQETFGDEFKSQSEYYQLPATPLFTIKQWEAYHSECYFYTHQSTQLGTYIEVPQIQARLYRPIKPIESVAEILEIEHQVNQNETLKKTHLTDMVVVAKKINGDYSNPI